MQSCWAPSACPIRMASQPVDSHTAVQPKDESVDYIKRVIGLPGDTVAYQDKQLTINGKPVPETPLPDYLDEERLGYAKQFEENLDGRKNAILNNPAVPPFIVGAEDYPYRDN